jgi:uncharacterized protein YerC
MAVIANEVWAEDVLRAYAATCIQRHSGRTGNRPYADNLLQETFAEALAASEPFKVFSCLDPNLAAALRTLLDRQRVVVHLADIEGLGYRQISVHTGIPLGRVKPSLHRAGADYAPDWAVMLPEAWAACLDQGLAQWAAAQQRGRAVRRSHRVHRHRLRLSCWTGHP